MYRGITQFGAPVSRRAARLASGFRRGLFEHVGALGRIVRVPQPPRSSRQHRVRANACAIPGWRSLWLLSLGQTRESNRRPDVTRTTYSLPSTDLVVTSCRRPPPTSTSHPPDKPSNQYAYPSDNICLGIRNPPKQFWKPKRKPQTAQPLLFSCQCSSAVY